MNHKNSTRSAGGAKISQNGFICTLKNTLFWLFLAPPADPVDFLWFKKTGCWTRTSKQYFRPQKSILSKIAIFCCFWAKIEGSLTRERLVEMKGLRAESARAFTGRRNSHSGRGEDFFTGEPDFFTETAVTLERKVEKWFPRWEINCHGEG